MDPYAPSRTAIDDAISTVSENLQYSPRVDVEPRNDNFATPSSQRVGTTECSELAAVKATVPKPKGQTGMNCSSCRKRRIRCDREQPCQSCLIFKSDCLYDTLPKKRGPKADGARKSRTEEMPGASRQRASSFLSQSSTSRVRRFSETASTTEENESKTSGSSPWLLSLQTMISPRQDADDTHLRSLIDLYFEKLAGKPFSFIHEPSIRYLMNTNSFPPSQLADSRASLVFAIAAMALQCTDQEDKTEETETLIRLAKSRIDQDEPSLENLQALIAFAVAHLSYGATRKSFMTVGVCCRMAIALDLLREPAHHLSPLIKETRRRTFWATYVLDRYTAAGSKRFAIYDDASITVNFPCHEEYWRSANSAAIQQNHTSLSNSEVQGFFSAEYNGTQQYLIVVSILGQAISYHQLGGVEGDSHFPWHQQSRLSKIRHALQNWASRNMQQLNLSEEQLSIRVGQSDGLMYLMMRGIYHVIHCLLYLNVLPMHISELETGPALQQTWRREAVETVLQHSHHIGELAQVLLGHSQPREIETGVPAFFGFCTFVAGVGHVYGSHYVDTHLPHRIGSSTSKSHLQNEFDLLNSLRNSCRALEHQFLILKILIKEHRAMITNGISKSVYYNEDILSRYDMLKGVDWSHCSLAPITGDARFELAGDLGREISIEFNGSAFVNDMIQGQFTAQQPKVGEPTDPYGQVSSQGYTLAAYREGDQMSTTDFAIDSTTDYLELNDLDEDMLMTMDQLHASDDFHVKQIELLDPFLMSLQTLGEDEIGIDGSYLP